MSLKAPTQIITNRVEQEVLDAGSYPARVVRVLDLGLQPQIDFATKEAKAPARMISVTYELVDEFMKDADGNILEDKPRWISEDFKLLPLSSDLAISTKRMKAIDPQNKLDGDWALTLGLPAMVVLGQYETKKNPGKPRNKVMGVTAPRARDVTNMPELVNEPKFFALDDPDMEVFKSLPKWQQEVIQGNLEYEGSKLQQLLGGASAPAPKEEPKKAAKPAAPKEEEAEYGDAPW